MGEPRNPPTTTSHPCADTITGSRPTPAGDIPRSHQTISSGPTRTAKPSCATATARSSSRRRSDECHDGEMLRARAIAATLLVLGLLVACDDDEPGARESAEAKIIEAGYAAGVEVSGSGQVLVSYVQPPEDDEGTYLSAWRLYDESGEPVADGGGSRVEGGFAQPTLWPLLDGFLMRRPDATGLERIDPTGDVSQVGFVDRGRPTRAGDVLLTQARFYRPADDTTYRLPERPRGVDSVAIDRDGGVWVVSREGETSYSRDGRAPWRTLVYDLARRLPGRAPSIGQHGAAPGGRRLVHRAAQPRHRLTGRLAPGRARRRRQPGLERARGGGGRPGPAAAGRVGPALVRSGAAASGPASRCRTGSSTRTSSSR